MMMRVEKAGRKITTLSLYGLAILLGGVLAFLTTSKSGNNQLINYLPGETAYADVPGCGTAGQPGSEASVGSGTGSCCGDAGSGEGCTGAGSGGTGGGTAGE